MKGKISLDYVIQEKKTSLGIKFQCQPTHHTCSKGETLSHEEYQVLQEFDHLKLAPSVNFIFLGNDTPYLGPHIFAIILFL